MLNFPKKDQTMAIKAKFIECECGALFQENDEKIIKGDVFFTPWRIVESKKLEQDSTGNSDVLFAKFTRDVCCEACKKELIFEHKNYEISPPDQGTESKIMSSSSSKYYF
jgi:hypothetical protein